MAERTCAACGKAFEKPTQLRRHQARKTPCAPILGRGDRPPAPGGAECAFCGRLFASYDSMRRHVRTACRIAPNPRNGGEGLGRLYQFVARRQADQIERQERQIERLSALVEEAAGAAARGGVSIRGDGNVVDARTTTISVNVFGQEGLGHLTPASIRAVLDEALGGPPGGAGAAPPPGAARQAACTAAVLGAALLVYSDPDHPENLTAFMPNKRSPEVLVHAEAGVEGWEVRPAELVVPQMARRAVDALFEGQPYEDAAEYAPLLRELAENERRYAAGAELRPILVRNKALLAQALAHLPVAGRPALGAR